MIIREVKTHLISALWRNFVIVELRSEEGLVGYGEGTLGDFEKTVVSAVRDIEPFIINRDIDISQISHFIKRNFFWRTGPVLSTAQSAIEQALWDLYGKTVGQPVYKLLGGKIFDKVEVYANGFISGNAPPEEYSLKAAEVVENGYNAMKFDPFSGAGPNISEKELDQACARLQAVRDRVGNDVKIMVEAHGRFNTRTAIKIAQRVKVVNPFWLEEPVPEDDIVSMSEVRKSSNVSIATGERILSLQRFHELLDLRGADIIQPDVCHMGGIFPLVNVATMANLNYVTVAPHNPNGPVATAASLNALVTMPNALILEFWLDAESVRKDIMENYFEIKNGYLNAPTKAGLGVDVNEDALQKYPYKKMHLEYFGQEYRYHGDVV